MSHPIAESCEPFIGIAAHRTTLCFGPARRMVFPYFLPASFLLVPCRRF
jgi:hypothetical protein